MKKHLLALMIAFISFTVLMTVSFSDYAFSSIEKFILIIIFSILIAYLFQLKIDANKKINILLEAAKISKVGFWTLDLTQNRLFWTDEIYDMFAIDKKKFNPSYEAFLNVIHPDDRESVNNAYTKSLETKEAYVIRHRLLMEDQTIKWVREECQTNFDKKGNPLLSIGIVTDITQEINNLEKIEESEKILHSIINATDDLIFFKDKNFHYLGCNDSFLKFVGKTKDELIGHSDFELFDNEMASLFREMDIKMLEKNQISSNYEWITYPDGEKYYVLTKKIPFHYTEEHIGILGMARDITELHLAQQQIEARSYLDELTKLHNRKSYNERIEELLARKKRYKTPFSMLMYDIDNFKSINDNFGHKVGDEVLIKMSRLIKSHIRECDYIFRIGGEEFVILLTETALENAAIVASKICKSVEENLQDITKKRITISIGLAEAQEDDLEDTIFKRVDTLLYHSKSSGKNRVSS